MVNLCSSGLLQTALYADAQAAVMRRFINGEVQMQRAAEERRSRQRLLDRVCPLIMTCMSSSVKHCSVSMLAARTSC